MKLFSKNDTAYLLADATFECGFDKGLFPFRIEEITVPVQGQELSVRDVVKLPDGYGLRFWEIRNPKFPHYSPIFGDDSLIDLEPLFKAIKFGKNKDGK